MVNKEDANVNDPEESFEQCHVHVVIVTIVHQAAVNIFYQHKPAESIIKYMKKLSVRQHGPPYQTTTNLNLD